MSRSIQRMSRNEVDVPLTAGHSGTADSRAGASAADQRTLDGLSAFDDLGEAIEQGRRIPQLGRFVVRYDIPEGGGITWEQSGKNPHHFDLFGDKDVLKRCLTDEWHEID